MMKTLQAIGVALALVGLVATSHGAAKGKSGKGKPDKAEAANAEVKPGEPGNPAATAHLKFTVEEQRVLETYVKGKKQKDLPPGLRKKLAKGGDLPPGWQKKLAAGEVMPTQVFAAATPFPPEIIAKLPPPPRGVIHVTIEGKAVRLLEATREIIDVFEIGGRR